LQETGDEVKAKHEGTKLAKVPAKDCPEFLRFRWAMQVANIQVATGQDRKTRTLSVEERLKLDAKMQDLGFFTPKQFKDAVREITGGFPDNIEQMLTHPDADKALVLDPARKALTRAWFPSLFCHLPELLQKRALARLRRGKTISPGGLITDAPNVLDAAIEACLSAENSKKSRKEKPVTRNQVLNATTACESLTGRAPYTRAIMIEAADFVFTTDRHPTDETGPLYRSEAIRKAQLERSIAEQTNNHLVRHRLIILERLHCDILHEYAAGNPARIARLTIEVNRELRDLSGKTNKQVAQDIGQRLANFKGVTARLEKAFAGRNIRITPGLIRKARIAEDLGWKCPYTGKDYDEFDLLHRKVDKDHIIPRSDRTSDSLDSLVITFAEVNRMKGKRTAVQFVEQCATQVVEGRPELSIKTLANFLKDVIALETFKGHDDDKRRKKRRKDMLQLRDYVEKQFTPRDLTQTSQLVRLGAQMLERLYKDQDSKPVITSLPGSVTGAVRKSWKLLGCLATANPLVLNHDELDDNGKPTLHNKTAIRGITHLHHALDACVLVLTSRFFPRDGGVWDLLVKRRLTPDEQSLLKSRFKGKVTFSKDGEPSLKELPHSLKEQIRTRLAERRVVQHIPKEMTGLRVEQNAWRVVSIQDGEALLRQSMRQPDGSRTKKEAREKVSKLLGLFPGGGIGKLQRNKSALIIPDNYGLALDPEPIIIPFHKVPVRLRELREKNGGKRPRVLRNGMLIRVPQGKFAGIWRIFSVKNNATGLALDIGSPDVVKLQNKVEGHKINVRLASLIRDGMKLPKVSLTGIAAGL
jgi:CRISPR-associated endonuclease Csn1